MIRLLKFGPAFGLPDLSPFVMKVETYFRITGQKYEPISGDIRKAPRKQLPVVDVDGRLIPDSSAIVAHFENGRTDKLDGHLDGKQRAVGLAFRSMLEEHLYFGMVFMRWATDDGWTVLEPALREMLGRMGVPSLMRGVVGKTARKQTVQRTRTQGVGRKPRTEVASTCTEIVDALATQLGDGAYFFGDRPTTYDATVYAFSAGLLCPAFDNELRRHAATKKNLVDYEKRMKDKYWAD